MEKRKFVQRTLVLIKPDSVMRGIIGSIISRFEIAGLKVIGLNIVQATREQLERHLPTHNPEWIRDMGEKNIKNNRANGIDPTDDFGTLDPMEIGKRILEWNFAYLLSGPVVVMVIEGVWAIGTVRKIIGDTIPAKALPGTIRGDFSINSADCDNHFKRSCFNVVHASGNLEEAEREYGVWFRSEELVSYRRYDESPFCELGEDVAMLQMEDIEDVFAQKKIDEPREAAELAYVIAMLAKNAGEDEKAIRYGRESIALFDQVDGQTIEECAARYVVVNSIALPSIIHGGVVRNRLEPLKL